MIYHIFSYIQNNWEKNNWENVYMCVLKMCVSLQNKRGGLFLDLIAVK